MRSVATLPTRIALAIALALALVVGAPALAADLPDPPGDVTDDGLTNVVDVQCSILLALWELSQTAPSPPTCLGVSLAAADINCDGHRDVIDVQALILRALGLPYAETVDYDGDGYFDACDPDDDDDGSPDPYDCAPLDSATWCAGSCCTPGVTPACSEGAVVDCVCGFDAFCCDSAWDDLCAEAALSVCGATCATVCGDGYCATPEGCAGCPDDCGACPACGDGVCGTDETCAGCPIDCGPCLDCGDGVCALAEGCLSCPADCGACAGDCCSPGDPGCDDPTIAECVCEDDPFCCAIAWDGACVEAASWLCAAPCAPSCGDGACTDGESCAECPSDCGPCATCGDGACDEGEGCDSCRLDCGPCSDCGDGACDPGETCDACPEDCGACTGDCCEIGATPGCDGALLAGCVCFLDPFCCESAWDDLCVAEAVVDCGAECPDVCGDTDCGPGESCATCPSDCGGCPSDCGDGVCGTGETCGSCPADCGACAGCGDGTCGGSETCGTCPSDCGACAGSCCAASAEPGCSDPAVQGCVCDLDDWCCAGSWDSLCVSMANTLCDAACEPSP